MKDPARILRVRQGDAPPDPAAVAAALRAAGFTVDEAGGGEPGVGVVVPAGGAAASAPGLPPAADPPTAVLPAGRDDLAALLDHTTAVIYAKDLQGRYLFINHQFETLFHVARGMAVGKTDFDFFPREMAEAFRANDRRVLAAGAPLEMEEVAPHADGPHTYISLKFPIFHADGPSYAVAGISTDITYRKRLEQELRDTNRELENQGRRVQEANRLKSEFLANMSHELRTPLNAIIGFVQLMYDGHVEPGSKEYMEFLNYVLSSARHLLQLINDVLDLAKVEAGRMEFSPEPVELEILVREVREVLRPVASRRWVEIDTAIAPDLGTLTLDPAKLKQVLYNYLSNAIKFSPEHGRVAVRLRGDGPEHFRLEVEDHGPGIRPEDVGRLFVEFQQLRGGADKKQPGTGLGLALVKRIVEAQGGSVGVETAAAQGSVFHVRLPRRVEGLGGAAGAGGGTVAGAVAVAIPPGAAGSVTEVEPGSGVPGGALLGVQPVAAAAPPAAPPAAPSAVAATAVRAGRCILVIEDDPRDRAVLVRMLEEAGYAVAEAATGVEALRLCREQVFAAITLDLVLPDMGGWDILRALRAGSRNRETPVLVVTLVAERSMGAAFAVQDVLAKPVTSDEVMAALKRAGIPSDGSRSVLVIDDDPKSLKLIEVTLARLGYRPVCRGNGEAGLAATQERLPDIIVLDLMMPVMNGFEFLRRFRARPEARRIPVLIWTNQDLTSEEFALLRPQAHAVVSKGQGGISPLVAELETCLLAFGAREGGAEGGGR